MTSSDDSRIAATPPVQRTDSPAEELNSQRILGCRIEELEADVDALRSAPPSRKDLWDKAEVVTKAVSGILVVGLVAFATLKFNERSEANRQSATRAQVRLQEVQTVSSFFPYLTSDDPKNVSAALRAIAALGNDSLSISLARVLSDSGSVAALAAIASASAPATAQAAQTVLSELTARMNVVRVSVPDGGGTRYAAGYVLGERGLAMTVAHVAASAAVITLEDAEGRRATAARIASDGASDLALLRFSADLAPRARQLACEAAQTDMSVLLSYYDAQLGWATQEGRVVAERSPRGIVIAGLRVSIGAAGSPVFGPNGGVVGLIRSVDGVATNLVACNTMLNLISSALGK